MKSCSVKEETPLLRALSRVIPVGATCSLQAWLGPGSVDRGDGQQPPGWTAWTDSGFSISTVNKRSNDDRRGKLVPSADAHPHQPGQVALVLKVPASSQLKAPVSDHGAMAMEAKDQMRHPDGFSSPLWRVSLGHLSLQMRSLFPSSGEGHHTT